MSAPADAPLAYFFFANAPPEATGYLPGLSGELDRLRALDDALRSAGVEPVFHADCSVQHLIDCLTDHRVRHRITMVHFAGHAEPDRWMMRGEDVPAHAEGLVGLLARLPGLELVVINGCSSAEQARRMVDAGIPAVVGTLSVIADDAAVTFSEAIYDALAGQETVANAFRTATDTVNTRFDESGRWRMARPRKTEAPRPQQPWALYTPPETEATWRIRDAVGDPLHGLPEPPRTPLPREPFRPYAPFGPGDGELYFGRRTDVRRVYDLMVAPDLAPVVLLYGQPGVGKTSLLEAGVLPRLRAAGYAIRHLSGVDDADLLARLRGVLGVEELNARSWRRAERALGQPIFLVLDQLDALRQNQAHAVGQIMGGVFDALAASLVSDDPPQGRALLTFGKGYLAEVRRDLVSRSIPYTHHFLAPLDRAGIVAAITGPLSGPRARLQYEITVEPGLPGLVAADLETSETAVGPVLQLVLDRMYRAADAGERVFDTALYRRIKEQGLWLDEVFDAAIDAIGARFPETQAPSRLLDLLLFHVSDDDRSRPRSREEIDDWYPDAPGVPTADLLQACLDPGIRLLTTWTVGDRVMTGLTHDVWGELVRRRYNQSNLEGQLLARTLGLLSMAWRQGRKALLDSMSLRIVEGGLQGMRRVTPEEQIILDASEAAEAARLKAIDDENRRKRFWLRFSLVTAIITAVMAVVTTAGLFINRHRANEATAERDRALAGEQSARRTARMTTARLERFQSTAWLNAVPTLPDPTLAAAALLEARDPAVGERADALAAGLGPAPIARTWMRGRPAGFDAAGRLAVVDAYGLVILDPQTNAVAHRVLPAGWTGGDVQFAIGPAGRTLAGLDVERRRALICDPDCRAVEVPEGADPLAVTVRGAGQVRFLVRRGDAVAVWAAERDTVWHGRACVPERGRWTFRGDVRWLFAGLCADGRGWHWGADGEIRRWAGAADDLDALARGLARGPDTAPTPPPGSGTLVGRDADGRWVGGDPTGLFVDGVRHGTALAFAAPADPTAWSAEVHAVSAHMWHARGETVVLWSLSAPTPVADRAELAARVSGCMPPRHHVAVLDAPPDDAHLAWLLCVCADGRGPPGVCIAEAFARRWPTVARLTGVAEAATMDASTPTGRTR